MDWIYCLVGIFKKLLNKIRIKLITRVKGKNNSVSIKGNILKKSKIKINGNNNKIIIEEGKYKNIQIGISGNNNILSIKSSERIGDLHVVIQNSFNSIILEENVYIGGTKIVSCGRNNMIKIGRDSMLSDNVEIWGCDAHSITQNGTIVNPSRSITIGERVWIGTGVKILKGAMIGKGSVIGIGSIVPGKTYPENVVIAGNPPTIIKDKIDWTFENLED